MGAFSKRIEVTSGGTEWAVESTGIGIRRFCVLVLAHLRLGKLPYIAFQDLSHCPAPCCPTAWCSSPLQAGQVHANYYSLQKMHLQVGGHYFRNTVGTLL